MGVILVSTALYEYMNKDSIEEPCDIFSNTIGTEINLPFRVVTIGFYKEGIQFRNIQYGFNSYCILLTLSGRGLISYHGQHKYVTRGDVTLTNNYEYTHVETAGDEWQFYFINFIGNSANEYEQLWNKGGLNICNIENVGEYSNYFILIRQYVNQIFPMCEIQNCLYITQLLTTGLWNLEQPTKESHLLIFPDWIKATKTYIDNNLSDNIKISDLASKFYMERTYFSRKFKHYLGVTPKEYQIRRRLEEGARLLLIGEKSISDISEKLGFSSPSYFTEQFKKVYKATPTEYRKKGKVDTTTII